MKTWRSFIKKGAGLGKPLSVILYYPYSLHNYISPWPRIPVLMYHKVIRDFIPGTSLNYCVTEASFERQMDYLARQGFRPLSIRQYIDGLYHQKPWPSKSLLITFDDGYSGVRRIAYPILKKYGFPAVAFVSCNFVGENALFPYDRHLESLGDHVFPELLPLNWGEAMEIQDLISIGSHTMSHVLLAPLSIEQIRYELAESKRVLEDKLGNEVLSFSYPGGLRQHASFDTRTRQILIDAGYKVAFNSEIGRNGLGSDPYLQKRIVVENDDSELLLSSKLAGSYDWARVAQWVFHLIYDSPANSHRRRTRCS